jgi:hypothetical protein
MNLMKIGLVVDIVLILTVFVLLGILFQKSSNTNLKVEKNIQRIEKIEK